MTNVIMALPLLAALGCAPSFTVQVGSDPPCESSEETCVIDFGPVLVGLSTDRRVDFIDVGADNILELDLQGASAFRMGARSLRDGGFVRVACIPEAPGPLEGTLIVLMGDGDDVEIGMSALAR